MSMFAEPPRSLAGAGGGPRRLHAVAAAAYPPTWMGEVELSAGLQDQAVPARDGEPYHRAGCWSAPAASRRASSRSSSATAEDQRGGPARGDRGSAGTPRGSGPHGERSRAIRGRDPSGERRGLHPRPRRLAARDAAIAAAVRLPGPRVIVVDNAAATDAASRVVAELGDARVQLVPEPRPGLSRARNRGVAEARGAVIAFTDDDVIVDPLWVRGLVRGLGRHAAVGCVTGLVTAAELETPAQHYFEHKVGWSDDCAPRLYDLGDHRLDNPLYRTPPAPSASARTSRSPVRRSRPSGASTRRWAPDRRPGAARTSTTSCGSCWPDTPSPTSPRRSSGTCTGASSPPCARSSTGTAPASRPSSPSTCSSRGPRWRSCAGRQWGCGGCATSASAASTPERTPCGCGARRCSASPPVPSATCVVASAVRPRPGRCSPGRRGRPVQPGSAGSSTAARCGSSSRRRATSPNGAGPRSTRTRSRSASPPRAPTSPC